MHKLGQIKIHLNVDCHEALNVYLVSFVASISGNTGVLHMLETDSDVDIILNTGPHAPYMVLMDAAFFNR